MVRGLGQLHHPISGFETDILAERVGFEPTVRLPVRLISSQVHSTTLPPLRDQKISSVREMRKINCLETTAQEFGLVKPLLSRISSHPNALSVVSVLHAEMV